MACPIKEVEGKSLVQITVPVCVTIQMDENIAVLLSQDELAGLVDEYIDALSTTVVGSGSIELWLHPRRWMNRLPVTCCVTRLWDELPIDELDITMKDGGCFELRGDGED